MSKRVTIANLHAKAQAGEKIVVLSLYDLPFASLAQQSQIDAIIVGDSVMMTLYGCQDTLSATMDTMLAHTQAVRRGAPDVFIIADMPYLGPSPTVEAVLTNARDFITAGQADAVKIEGARPVIEHIKATIDAGIPVVGHLGVQPQLAAEGGSVRRVEARDARSASKLVTDAIMVDQAGVCLLVLEAVAAEVADEIVKRVRAPVIGIGAGPSCQGQVLLAYDILGLFPQFTPKFVKRYAQLAPTVIDAFNQFIAETRQGQYPAPEHCYKMKADQHEAFAQLLAEIDAASGQ